MIGVSRCVTAAGMDDRRPDTASSPFDTMPSDEAEPSTREASPPVDPATPLARDADRVDADRIFDDSDRLMLLQLETRRKVAERLRRMIPSPDDDLGETVVAPTPVARIPRKWRLLPNGARLHAWQKKCLPLWLERGRGTVKVATGGGKTFFAFAAAQELQRTRESDLRVVIVVPTIPLMTQWRSELRTSNLPESSIALLGGSESPASLDGVRILICVLASARQKLPEIVSAAGWSDRMLLVVDECHRSRATQARRIFDCDPRYTLGLSATPETADDDDAVPARDAYDNGVVGKALGPIIFELSLEECHAAGLLSPFELSHVGLPLDDVERSEHVRLSDEISDLRKPLQALHARLRSKQPFIAWCQSRAAEGGELSAEAERFMGLANARKRLLYRASARATAVRGLMRKELADPAARAIVFHESIDEIETIFLDLLDADVPAVLEHSKLPDGLRAENIEAFRDGVARAIVSAKSLVEGFNVPAADVGIIAASSGSVRQRIQSLGRLLRRKKGNSTARVYVLYVRDSEDEVIYEKADWDRVTGAERNRYFEWEDPGTDIPWEKGLREKSGPPRAYRPPAAEIDTSSLVPGNPWPGQTHGFSLHVDHADNLRMEDGTLVPTSRDVIERIIATNPHRKATLTPARQLITRAGGAAGAGADWIFLAAVAGVPEPVTVAERLKVGTVAGRPQIIRGGRTQRFALGSDSVASPAAVAARDMLLEWVHEVGRSSGRQVTHLFWDRDRSYWVELEGRRIPFPGPIGPLEFPS